MSSLPCFLPSLFKWALFIPNFYWFFSSCSDQLKAEPLSYVLLFRLTSNKRPVSSSNFSNVPGKPWSTTARADSRSLLQPPSRWHTQPSGKRSPSSSSLKWNLCLNRLALSESSSMPGADDRQRLLCRPEASGGELGCSRWATRFGGGEGPGKVALKITISHCRQRLVMVCRCRWCATLCYFPVNCRNDWKVATLLNCLAAFYS